VFNDVNLNVMILFMLKIEIKLQKSYLLLGHCMTYNSSSSDEQESDAILFGSCPYVYYSNIHVINHGNIALPHNISGLNDAFCTPLNRDGLLGRDCIDGFGLSIGTIGYACANCTANNYGWMLYILSELSEFVPATVFYFVILTFQIRIKSVPMDCFVMFSQLVVIFPNYTRGFKRDSSYKKSYMNGF